MNDVCKHAIFGTYTLFFIISSCVLITERHRFSQFSVIFPDFSQQHHFTVFSSVWKAFVDSSFFLCFRKVLNLNMSRNLTPIDAEFKSILLTLEKHIPFLPKYLSNRVLAWVRLMLSLPSITFLLKLGFALSNCDRFVVWRLIRPTWSSRSCATTTRVCCSIMPSGARSASRSIDSPLMARCPICRLIWFVGLIDLGLFIVLEQIIMELFCCCIELLLADFPFEPTLFQRKFPCSASISSNGRAIFIFFNV